MVICKIMNVGNINIESTLSFDYSVITTNGTLMDNVKPSPLYYLESLSGTPTIYVPDLTLNVGRIIFIKNNSNVVVTLNNNTPNQYFVNPDGTQSTTLTLTVNECIMIFSDGSNWHYSILYAP